jgi:hypothetical protein
MSAIARIVEGQAVSDREIDQIRGGTSAAGGPAAG